MEHDCRGFHLGEEGLQISKVAEEVALLDQERAPKPVLARSESGEVAVRVASAARKVVVSERPDPRVSGHECEGTPCSGCYGFAGERRAEETVVPGEALARPDRRNQDESRHALRPGCRRPDGGTSGPAVAHDNRLRAVEAVQEVEDGTGVSGESSCRPARSTVPRPIRGYDLEAVVDECDNPLPVGGGAWLAVQQHDWTPGGAMDLRYEARSGWGRWPVAVAVVGTLRPVSQCRPTRGPFGLPVSPLSQQRLRSRLLPLSGRSFRWPPPRGGYGGSRGSG